MRITALATSYPRHATDSTAPFVRSICESLAGAGHEVAAVLPFAPGSAPNAADHTAIHRFRYAPLDRWHIMGHGQSLVGDARFRLGVFVLLPAFLWQFWRTTLRVARQQRTDLLHAHWVVPSGALAAAAAARLRVPFAISLHGSDIFVALRNPLLGRLAGYALRRAAVVTACSPELRAGAIQLGARPERVTLLPWGADPQLFRPDIPSLDRGRVELSAEQVLVGAIGRVVPKKGFDVLIRALAELAPEHPRLQLVIAGSGPQQGELAALAGSLGIADRVHWLGQLAWNEVPGFLTMLDVFVLPSILDPAGNLDGLPTVLLEAMAAGRPVVATRIGGVPLVIEDGQNGILCPPADPGRLADAVRMLADSPELRVRLAAAARQSVVERFNWTAVARQFTTLFEQSRTAAPAGSTATRLGTQYRAASFEAAGREFTGARVLDAGCFDGALLGKVAAALKVGIDLEPAPLTPGVHFIRASAEHLPFRSGTFDRVLATDLIEHVPAPGDVLAMAELQRVLAPGGELFVTTPSASIRLFPPFLTRWISQKWGHFWRLGYRSDELREMVTEPDVDITEWNAGAYRTWYLPLRLVAKLVPGLASRLVSGAARWDAVHRRGERGFRWVTVRKRGAAE